MPSALSNKLSLRNARDLINTIQNSDSEFYIFYGRTKPWDDEDVPPEPGSTLLAEYNAWHDMTAMKRVDGQDVRLGFKRIDWESGIVYDEYTDNADLSLLNYYVYTDEQNVYKCISNNNGTASTVKPTHTSSLIMTEADGYKWKYMFTISDSIRRKFYVPGYLPIFENESVMNSAQPGTVNNVEVVTRGTGYTPSSNVPVFIGGDGQENASAEITISVFEESIVGASLTFGGSNYPYAPESNIPVAIRQIGVNGAVQNAYALINTNAEGQVISITPVLGGSGYSDGQAYIVEAAAEGVGTTNSAGELLNVEVPAPKAGSNIRKAHAVVIAESTTPAQVRPIISPFNGHGADPAKELIAKYALINLRFAYDEGDGDFTIDNDFRTIGLIQNPLEWGSTDILANSETLDAKYRLILDQDNVSFVEDDTIVGQTSGAVGLQVDLFQNNVLRLIRDNEISNTINFEIGETVTGLASSASAVITDIQPPEVEPYSGDILFINNRESVDRQNDQIESVTLVMEY